MMGDTTLDYRPLASVSIALRIYVHVSVLKPVQRTVSSFFSPVWVDVVLNITSLAQENPSEDMETGSQWQIMIDRDSQAALRGHREKSVECCFQGSL